MIKVAASCGFALVGKSTSRFPAIGNPRGDAKGIAERHSAVSSGFCTAGTGRGPRGGKERTRRRIPGP